MSRWTLGRSALRGALGLLALSVVVAAAVRAQHVAVDQQAVDLLRRATTYIGGLEAFSVDTQSTFEDLLETGHRVDYELAGTTVVRRPDKLHSERHGNHISQIFFYDGESLTLYNPGDKVYATEPAPGTIEEMLLFAYDTLGIGSPMSDLVHRDAFPALMQDVDFAVVVGKEMLRGVVCDHLLFSRPGVDFQVWVPDAGPPLPMKYLVTDTGTPELLSVSAYLANWNTTPDVPDDLFNFVPPADASAITFLKVDPSETYDR